MLPGFLRALQSPALAAGNAIVVVVGQMGGCDFINTVVPLKQYGKYTDLRRPAGGDQPQGLNIPLASLAATAFDDNHLTPASGASTYAFNPTMTAMRSLYASGKLAVLPGIGIVPEEVNRYSHETGQYDWQTASINGKSFTGWMGRAVDGTPEPVLPALISVSGDAPLLMRGNLNSGFAVSTPLDGFSFDPGGEDPEARFPRFTQIQGQPTSDASGEFVRGVSNTISTYIGRVQDLATRVNVNDYPQSPSDGFLSLQLSQIARLILGGSPTRGYFAAQGGYDTHSYEMADHPGLVGEFSDALANFYNYLRAKGASSNVIVMTYTDFGRRPQGNDTFGTDHSSAAVNFVFGDSVRGGVYGKYPNLSALDDDGDPVVAVDFRNQISDVLSFMGADTSTILGRTYPKMGFL